jgi:hypothetical protein
MSCHQSITATLAFLRRLAEDGFWGSVTTKFEAGKIVHIVRQESIIPTNLNLKEEPKPHDNINRY